MKKDVKEKVLEFMRNTDTSGMNSNKFIFDFIQTLTGDTIINEVQFREAPSVETILRCRRYVIADYGIGKRTKADIEEVYINEFARTDRYN